MKRAFWYQTAIGRIGIAESYGAISNLFFGTESASDFLEEETPLLQEAKEQLFQYLAGKREGFRLPLKPQGTDFQQTVWAALRTIPYGETWSYKQVAGKIGNEKAARAVGLANNKNPIPVLIPCHRVVGTNGKLVGYRGGLELKSKLLALEQGKVLKKD